MHEPADEAQADSDRWFRMLVEYSTDDAIVVAPDGTLLNFIHTAQGMGVLGYTGEELLGANVLELVHANDLPGVRRDLARVRDEPATPVRASFRCRHQDGSWRHIEAIAVNRLSDSAVGGIVVNYRDTTDRKRDEERQRVLLRTLSDVGVGILYLHDERIADANEAFCAISGYSREELIALPSYFSMILPEQQESLTRHLRRHLAGRTVTDRYELIMVHKTGREVNLEISMKAVLAEDLLHLVAIVRDVTERKREEAARLHARDVKIASLQTEVGRLRRRVGRNFHFENIIGQSPAMQAFFSRIETAASADLNVLITGESGTGKELVAKAIHYNSQRRDKPILEYNCAAMRPELAPSTLFGHRKGAFTGAMTDSAGLFELAHEGTLLLDEIGDMPLEIQPTLLRALQERKIQRVGEESRLRDADVRILAITNRDLEADVQAGRFRSDLYYRLSVFPIHVPPLRERLEDIPLLAEHFLERASKQLETRVLGFEPGVFEMLRNYLWPGNVRELEHAVSVAVALTDDGERIRSESFPARIRQQESLIERALAEPTDYESAVQLFRRRLVENALRRCEGNRTQAAKLLRMERTNLVGLIKRLGIAE